MFSGFSKILILTGLFFVAAGLLAAVAGKIPGAGRLPGDIFIRKGNFTFYFPWVTSLLISILLTLFFSIFRNK